MSNFFPIGTFLAVLFGAGQIISQAAKTAPNLGRFKRWGVAIALYVGFLITLAGFWVLGSAGVDSRPLSGTDGVLHSRY